MIPSGVEIYVALEPVDMRLSFDRLAGLAREQTGYDARSGALFIFFGRRMVRTSFSIPIEHHHDPLPMASPPWEARAACASHGSRRPRGSAHRSAR